MIDAIYILYNYVVNKEIYISKKKGKIFAFFVDFKMAFDRIDRIKQGEMLKKMREQLKRRMMETYKETKSIIKVGNRKSEELWTKSEVKKECHMSLTLFNIYLMNVETEMRKKQTGGIVVEKEKIWSISYADDIVLLAKSEQELKRMIKRFRKYVERKRLILSSEKSKVMY